MNLTLALSCNVVATLTKITFGQSLFPSYYLRLTFILDDSFINQSVLYQHTLPFFRATHRNQFIYFLRENLAHRFQIRGHFPNPSFGLSPAFSLFLAPATASVGKSISAGVLSPAAQAGPPAFFPQLRRRTPAVRPMSPYALHILQTPITGVAIFAYVPSFLKKILWKVSLTMRRSNS